MTFLMKFVRSSFVSNSGFQQEAALQSENLMRMSLNITLIFLED